MNQQQQQQPQFQHPVMVGPPHVSPKSMWVSKVVLRSFVCAFDLIEIGVSVAVTLTVFYGSADALIYFVPPAALSLIWSFSEIICIAVRGGHRGIHPGACVGLDLIIWLVFLVMVIIYALVGVLFRPYGSSYDYYGYNYGDTSNVEASMSMYRTIFSFAIILFLLHFTLFVIACYETSVRNRNPRVVVYQAGPNPYHQSMPPNMYNQGQIYQQPSMGYVQKHQQQNLQQQPTGYPPTMGSTPGTEYQQQTYYSKGQDSMHSQSRSQSQSSPPAPPFSQPSPQLLQERTMSPQMLQERTTSPIEQPSPVMLPTRNYHHEDRHEMGH